MTTKTINVDLMNGTWAASFEGQTPCGFGGDNPTTAIMRLINSCPEFDFLIEQATADYDLMTDTHLVMKIPVVSTTQRFKEALIDKHVISQLKNLFPGL